MLQYERIIKKLFLKTHSFSGCYCGSGNCWTGMPAAWSWRRSPWWHRFGRRSPNWSARLARAMPGSIVSPYRRSALGLKPGREPVEVGDGDREARRW